MLILFVGDGRLGNQVFQYAALSTLGDARSRIIAMGLEDLQCAFELSGPRCTVIRGGLWIKRVVKYLLRPLLLRPLSRWLRLISYASETHTQGRYGGREGKLALRPGLFRGIVFVDGGYYQNSDYWPQLFPPPCLELRETWRQQARALLAQEGAGAQPVFLHVRRADYIGFTSYGLDDLLLPTAYFRDGIAQLRARLRDCRVVMVTDDRDWVRREFADVPDCIVVSSNPLVDFAVMAECAGGIVSNSTFSLAAALFMRDPHLVLAPEFWFGFRVQQWLPPRIRFEHSRIEYLAIGAGAT